jgi:hypothetical protein
MTLGIICAIITSPLVVFPVVLFWCVWRENRRRRLHWRKLR